MRNLGKRYVVAAALLAFVAFGSAAALAYSQAEIGSSIGSFQLSDLSGADLILQSNSGKILVLVFWSFKCPVSLSYDGRIEELQSKYAGRGIEVLAMAPGNQSSSEVRANIANLKITFPVLLDPEGSAAEKLGATHTPSAFVIDGNGVLRYRGSLDNNRKAGEKGRTSYIEDALDALLSGRSIPKPETRSFGCSIKTER